MAVLLAILVGIMVLLTVISLFVAIAAAVGAGAGGGMAPAEVGVLFGMLVIYVATTAIYAFPMMYLFKYASRIQQFLLQGGVERLDHALAAQKAFWKFIGIAILVFIGLYAAMVVLMLGFGFVGAF